LAVYTKLTAQDIESFLENYDIGTLVSFKGITEGVENTNYLIVTSINGEHGRYILTLYEQRVLASELPFFLGLTEWLADRNIACPRPVKSRDERIVFTLKDRPAAIIHFLHGRGSPHITSRHTELAGELLARMHLAAEGFPMTRRNALSVDGWNGLFQRFKRDANSIAIGLEQDLEQELLYLEEHWPHGLPQGVIHADVFPDNVFFIDGNTDQPELSGVIDFYFACNDFWMYDVMICMNAWCFDAAHIFIPERAAAMLNAYNRLRPFTEAERLAMPILARGAALRFLATRAHDWLNRVDGALVNPKDPMEYVTKLRFHQRVRNSREYGLT
jgi:homoserine kinase type II